MDSNQKPVPAVIFQSIANYTDGNDYHQNRIALHVPTLLYNLRVGMAKNYQFNLLKFTPYTVISYMLYDFWNRHCQVPFGYQNHDMETYIWEDVESGEYQVDSDQLSKVVNDILNLIYANRNYFDRIVNAALANQGVYLQDGINDLLYAGESGDVVYFQLFYSA